MNDRDTRDALISEHLSLVAVIARRLARKLPAHVDEEELAADGVMGLIAAATHFDRKLGVPFEHYAQRRIRGAMIDALRLSDTLSRDMRRLSDRLRNAYRALEARLGRSPTQEESAAEAGMTLTELNGCYRRLHGWAVVSIEDVDNGRFLDITAGPADVFADCSRAEEARILTDAILSLPDQQARAAVLYYGRGLTMLEIGKLMGVTESRVCQVLGEAHDNLRARLDPALAA